MENHENDRILLIEDDPMVRLMAVLTQYADEYAVLADDRGLLGLDPASPTFASIFDPRP